MSKIKFIGNGFVQVDRSLYNIREFVQISQVTLGLDEESAYGICLYPKMVTQEEINRGVSGEFFITTYKEEEREIFEADFQTIIKALEP